jgi:hypothetical protein
MDNDQTKEEAIREYEQRQRDRAERYTELADKAKERSTAAYERSSTLSGMIPFGQPVLVGHHSEGRHRRDIERIHAAMDRSVEESKKAEYYTDKASAALNNTAISSEARGYGSNAGPDEED